MASGNCTRFHGAPDVLDRMLRPTKQAMALMSGAGARPFSSTGCKEAYCKSQKHGVSTGTGR